MVELKLDHKDAEAIAALEFGSLEDKYFNAAALALHADWEEHGKRAAGITNAAIAKMMGMVK